MKAKGSSEYRLLSGLFFRLLPYQILLIVINAVNGIVDSLYASNVIGKSAMSAIGLFGPFNHFLYAASMLFVSGTQMLYGRYLAKDREKIPGLISVNLVVSGALAAASALPMVLLVVTGATRIFIDTQPDLQMLNDYILGQAVGIPALVLGQQLFALLSLENRKKLTMAASIACFAVNAALDHVFIVLIPMGTLGLGLSTALSFWVFLAVQAAYYIRGKSEWKISLRGCRWKDAGKIFTLGYPGALSRFVEMFRCLIVNGLILAYIGNAGISSFAASNSLLAVIWAVPFGMVAVSRMLFSISIGEEDRRSLVDVFKIVMTKGLLLMAGIIALLVIFAEPLTRLFYRDPSDPVYSMTVMGFRLLPLCMILSVASLHFGTFAQTAEKKVLSVLIPVIDGMAGVTLCSLVLIPLTGNSARGPWRRSWIFRTASAWEKRTGSTSASRRWRRSWTFPGRWWPSAKSGGSTGSGEPSRACAWRKWPGTWWPTALPRIRNSIPRTSGWCTRTGRSSCGSGTTAPASIPGNT